MHSKGAFSTTPEYHFRLQNVHAIGDRANGLVLDAFEAALKDSDVKSLRPRLEHAQLLAQRDMARFGGLGGEFESRLHSPVPASANNQIFRH